MEAAAQTPKTADAVTDLIPVEQVVAEVWSEVLGTEITSRENNFFAHGGDSLRATEVAARLAHIGVAGADVGQLLSHQTLGEFSAVCPRRRDARAGR